MAFELLDCHPHLRQVMPAVVDLLDFGRDAGDVVEEPFRDLSGRTDLSMSTAVRPAEVVQCPARHTIPELLFVLAPPR